MRSLVAKNPCLSAHDSLVGIFEDTCRKVRHRSYWWVWLHFEGIQHGLVYTCFLCACVWGGGGWFVTSLYTLFPLGEVIIIIWYCQLPSFSNLGLPLSQLFAWELWYGGDCVWPEVGSGEDVWAGLVLLLHNEVCRVWLLVKVK